MEESVLNVLGFSLCAPTIASFLKRYTDVSKQSVEIRHLSSVKIAR